MRRTRSNIRHVVSRTNRLLFGELNMKEAAMSSKAGKVVILPIGSVEEHGEHLPLCTDSLQPEYVALEVAKKTNCLVAPPLEYGVCNSTRGFPGTISIEFESLRGIMYDILKEFIRNGFSRLLVLSGHAGQAHMSALRLAAQEVLRDYEKEDCKIRIRIMVCSDYDFAYELKGKHFDERDGHAGAIETSRVMAIRSDLVRSKGEESYPELPRFEVITDLNRYFPSGVIGDPSLASISKGRMVNKYVIDGVVKLVERLKH